MDSAVEVAKYRITGLVDKFDEQMNIIGQFPIGSVQELPVEVGVKLVALGTVEAVAEEGDEVAEAPAEAPVEAPVEETPAAPAAEVLTEGQVPGDVTVTEEVGDDEDKDEEVE